MTRVLTIEIDEVAAEQLDGLRKILARRPSNSPRAL
jgi:hypothetical protein